MIGEVAILKTDGTAVKLDSSFSGLTFDYFGFLIRFSNQNKIYQYYQNGDFHRIDNFKRDLAGYYAEEDYLLYIANKVVGGIDIEKLVKSSKFRFEDRLAEVDDAIIVNVVDFGTPFNFYYNVNRYVFHIEHGLDPTIPKKYKKPIFKDLKLLGYELELPNSIAGTLHPVDKNNTPPGFFYKKHFSDQLSTWLISDADKKLLKRLTTLICFRIAQIVERIFPKLISANALQSIHNVSLRTTPGISDLSEIDQLGFLLLKGWGYFYDPSLGENSSYIHKRSLELVLTGQPNFYEFENYYRALSNFYFRLYKVQDDLLSIPARERFRYLLELLSPSALGSIPYPVLKKTFSSIIVGRALTEGDEQFVVRLTSSIKPQNADDFLDFLLESENGKTTNFEFLYSNLDDARMERYTFINWFVNEQTNRKYFAFGLYNLWKISKYNITFSNSIGKTPYFVEHPEKLNLRNILIFETNSSTVNTDSFSNVEVSFISSIQNSAIDIDIRKKETVFNPHPTNDLINDKQIQPKREDFGAFHFYHPITVIGFKPNLDIVMPKESQIPAFLFHFVEEYNRLAIFDAAINLLIDVSIDTVLFFALGGTTILKDLRYLKNVTQIGRAWLGEPLAQSVEVWRGLESGAEVLSLSASTIYNSYGYLEATETDPVKEALWKKNREFWLKLLIVSGIGSAYSRLSAIDSANQLLDIINNLPPGVAHGFDNAFINLLTTIKGEKAVALLNYRDYLNTLDFASEVNHIILKYDPLTDLEKLAFWEAFSHLEPNTWKVLNQNSAAAVSNWINLYRRGILEAKKLELILDQLVVNSMIRYYDDPVLKPYLEQLGYSFRLKFLKDFGQIEESLLLNLKSNPQKVWEWSGVDAVGKLLLKENEYFWIRLKLKLSTIKDIQPYFDNEIIKIKPNSARSALLTDISRKDEAIIKFASQGDRWQNGKAFESIAEEYLHNTYTMEIYFEVDIRLKDINGEDLIKGKFQELDGLLINETSGKIDKILSIKLPNRNSSQVDFPKLESFMSNLPDNGEELRNYIRNTPELRKINDNNIALIDKAEIKYRTYSSGKEFIEVDPSIFKLKIKSSYNRLDDFEKITPEVIGITREDFDEAAYFTFRNKLIKK